MILFTILLLILLILAVVAILALAIGGSIGIIVFGDLIVCILCIVFIMKRIIKKRRNRKR